MASFDTIERQYRIEVEELKKWWSDSRWRYTTRAFSAEQIAAKRGSLTIQYPGNVQSKKLWHILEDRFKVRFVFDACAT
jgi:isocitrate lyase